MNPTYLFGIKEIFRWYYRRGSQITPDAIITSISFNALQNRIDFQTKTNLESAFRKFTEAGIYRRMSQPHYNKEITINLNDNNTLTYTAPVVFKDDKRLFFASYDLGEVTPDYFLNRYEALFLTTWSFYVLDTVPSFINLYFDGKEIKEQYFRPNMEYVKHSKERLIHLGRGLGYNKAPPPPEICLQCNRSKECLTTNVEKLLRK